MTTSELHTNHLLNRFEEEHDISLVEIKQSIELGADLYLKNDQEKNILDYIIDNNILGLTQNDEGYYLPNSEEKDHNSSRIPVDKASIIEALEHKIDSQNNQNPSSSLLSPQINKASCEKVNKFGR